MTVSAEEARRAVELLNDLSNTEGHIQRVTEGQNFLNVTFGNTYQPSWLVNMVRPVVLRELENQAACLRRSIRALGVECPPHNRGSSDPDVLS